MGRTASKKSQNNKKPTGRRRAIELAGDVKCHSCDNIRPPCISIAKQTKSGTKWVTICKQCWFRRRRRRSK